MITRDGLARIALRFGVLAANAILFGVAARSFDPQQMGIWALASALTTIVMSLDLGMSMAVRNQLAFHEERQKEFFTAGLRAVIALALIYAVVTLVVYLCFPAGAADSRGIQAALPYLLISAFLLFLRMPCAVATNAFYSFNEANLFNVFEFATMFAGVATALVLIMLKLSIRDVLVGFYSAGTAVAWVALLLFIRRRHWDIRWRSAVRLSELGGTAWQFGLLQVVQLGLSSTPAFVIGSAVGIADVTAVRATVIIGQAVLSLHLAHAMPLWTSFSRIRPGAESAAAVADLQRRLVKEVALLAVVFLALAAASPLLINLWVGRHVANFSLCLAFSFWAWGWGICNVYSLVLNGRNQPLKTLLAILPGTAVIVLLSKLLAVRWGSVGVGGSFAIGAAISAALMVFLASRELRSLGRQGQVS